ncbi:MAG TPA: acyltransferase [Chthonomonadaceae bacterium]|nr:acyltransferase [Chthonomonadaceae bacterium]
MDVIADTKRAPAVPRDEILPPAAKTEKPRLRLDYLDGLRGLAALYVVLFHAYIEINWHWDGGGLPAWALRAASWMVYGHYAVAVFIVLSGYCLMLPVARSADGKLRGGVGEYLKRRARRILPPYYAALVLSLLLIRTVPGMNERSYSNWNWALPAFTPGVLWSHFLLVHNLSFAWAGKINPPMWSVATEWQIYFIFPALLLPVWRRLGLIAAVAVGFAVGLGLHWLFWPYTIEASFWYIGLFALGMAGAVVGFSEKPQVRAWRERAPWGLIAALAAAVFVAVAIWRPEWVRRQIGLDMVVGTATVALIIACTRHLTERPATPRSLILRLLGARPVVGLGTFSYSLYLVHAPLLSMLNMFLKTFWLTPIQIFGLLLVVGVPLSVGLAYLFHLAFERRFMSGHAKPLS